MAKDYSKAFYHSAAWQKLAQRIREERFFLCELCNKPAKTVHHIKPITPSNIDDPTITMNPANLQLLCHACHEAIHDRATPHMSRVRFTPDGQPYTD